MSKVSLFIPCAVNALLVGIGESTVKLMLHLGYDIDYHEEHTCCGQPAVTAGHTDIAKKVAKRFIEIFENDEFIVSPSGSCVATVKNGYAKLFKDEPKWKKRAEELSTKVYELSQFIVDIAGVEDLGAEYSGKITYHESCHLLRELGVSNQPKILLENVKYAELVPLNAAQACCGFGGQFALKYPYISNAILLDKKNNVINSGAETLVVSDPGCLLNIGGYFNRHHPNIAVKHIATFLAENLQREGV